MKVIVSIAAIFGSISCEEEEETIINSKSVLKTLLVLIQNVLQNFIVVC